MAKATDKPEPIGDEPIEPRLHDMMNALAQGVDEILNGDMRPKRNGFALLVFPFSDFDGRCNYISNARKDDMIKLLEWQLARLKERTGQERPQ